MEVELESVCLKTLLLFYYQKTNARNWIRKSANATHRWWKATSRKTFVCLSHRKKIFKRLCCKLKGVVCIYGNATLTEKVILSQIKNKNARPMILSITKRSLV